MQTKTERGQGAIALLIVVAVVVVLLAVILSQAADLINAVTAALGGL